MSGVRETGRLSALVVLALFVCALGVLAGEQVILVAAVVPIAYGLYGQLTTLPSLSIGVERTVSESNPAPGEYVDVRLTITNTGEATVPKLHVVDGVPAELGVADGSPRLATALRPGESTTLVYTLVARRGTHEFGDTYVGGQSFGGTEERDYGIDASGATGIACHAEVSDPISRDVTHKYTGQVATDDGGTGLEFYATREHQHGDPVSHIDWNRYARDGELTTIEYRERRGTPVVVVVDLRSSVDVARRNIDPPASELGIYAAHRLFEPLSEYGNQVGLAFYTDDGVEWLPPGRGAGHESRAVLALREAADRDWSDNTMTLARRQGRSSPIGAGTIRADGSAVDGRLDELAERLPTTANIVLVTPLLDQFPHQVATFVRAFGHDLTVLTPDVVPRTTVGSRVAALDREVAVTRLQRTGATVVSWDPDEPLARAITQTLEGHL
jgi:uncharacterized protein (DUF58 family)